MLSTLHLWRMITLQSQLLLLPVRSSPTILTSMKAVACSDAWWGAAMHGGVHFSLIIMLCVLFPSADEPLISVAVNEQESVKSSRGGEFSQVAEAILSVAAAADPLA